MHEWSITRKVVNSILKNSRENGIKKVNRVVLSVGEDIDFLDSIEFCFEMLSKGTIIEGAKLEIKKFKEKGIIIDSIEGEQ